MHECSPYHHLARSIASTSRDGHHDPTMSNVSQPSLLAAVIAADNAPGPYAHPDATSHPKTWAEDHEDLYPFHLTREDHDRGNVVPIGWIRPQVADLLLNHWPVEELGERRSLQVELDCVHFADWVLQDGMDGMDREMARLSKYMKDSGYFAECLGGMCLPC